MCRKVAARYLGRIVEQAPRELLFRTPRRPYTAALLSAIPLPDPVRERQRRRASLEGEPPDPASIPAGCRFHKRCPRASELCRREDPMLQEVAPGHQAACHHMLDA
ncbi:hypothetical protein GCM10007874_26010 [Labrys miyagiensis]|uniref:Oligopeptide/dipeptide ABC transporter C-terminal domain-containing protein n=2 Tax=Labrys miyagiensis TaxID=346912 RepID=A0ABQ6CH71_9HYPH|nr:hypothetical protein GCM10007874_26010 [Labrys miyagiensis]